MHLSLWSKILLGEPYFMNEVQTTVLVLFHLGWERKKEIKGW